MVETPSPLHHLAAAAGLTRIWEDVEGCQQVVPDGALSAILAALGHDTGSDRKMQAALRHMQAASPALPKMIFGDVTQPVPMPKPLKSKDGPVVLTGEDGTVIASDIRRGVLSPVLSPGYYHLAGKGWETELAIAPLHCPLPDPGRRHWGVSLQIPSLRSASPAAFGNFGELADAVGALARAGADAVAINPVHALFPGVGDGFSPYSPSSRLFLNTAMGDPALVGLPPLSGRDADALIDWPQAIPARMVQLRQVFDALDPALLARIASDCAAEGEALRRHAIFDALDRHFRPGGAKGWQDWPTAYRDPTSAAVARFAQEQVAEVSFQMFLQWLARKGLEAAQMSAKAGGMSIGLIGDLAVGVTPGGSDAWSMPDVLLRGLTIGAPPDPLGPLGQNWSITSFSPQGLRATGYAPWIAMIRAAMRSSGGLRIDHAFGLARLWVIPEGGTSADGAYLSFPFDDLVRLATLEAWRADCLVIAEDLGTAPPGFTQAISERRMLGMRVLWFERAQDHGFIGAQDYPPDAVAMTGTHDTQTLAGWWSGRDLDWAAELGRLPDGVDRAQAGDIRAWDRGLLWSTICRGDRPAPDDTDPVVDAAIAHIADTPSQLAIVPLEDLSGEREQPNIPGTVTEHPNWQRRMEAPMDALLARADVQRRTDSLNARH